MDTISKEEYETKKMRFEELESKEEMTNEELQELDDLANESYSYETEQEDKK